MRSDGQREKLHFRARTHDSDLRHVIIHIFDLDLLFTGFHVHVNCQRAEEEFADVSLRDVITLQHRAVSSGPFV